MVKTLVLEKQDCDHLLGTFLDDSHYDFLIEENYDVYRKMDALEEEQYHENGEHNIILKFRKNYFTKKQQAGAHDGLKEAAQPSQNRGLAAGPRAVKLQKRDWVTNEQLDILAYLANIGETTIDANYEEDIARIRALSSKKIETRGMVWLTSEREKHNFTFENWLEDLIFHPIPYSPENIRKSARWVQDTLISDTTYANPVDSGIAGWFDRYPRIPYGRATSYTANNMDKFKLSYPFLQSLSEAFRKLLPLRYANQLAYIQALDESFYAPGTVFTTITVNKNFRTAAHKDAGDLSSGFSNLTVVAKDNDYTGGYLVLPEIRAAVNIRPGDLLLVANHDYIHGNTPIEAKAGADLERISLVCYFREAMHELGERRYEDLRYEFVESRRKNKDHPQWRDGWNGVSKDMFESDEWYNFLKANDAEKYIAMYHSKSLVVEESLESLFE